MPSFAKTIATIYRDFVTDGVPTSGKNDPTKSDIRVDVGKMQSYMDGGVLNDLMLPDAKMDIVAGVLRQDASDLTKWQFLNDDAHRTVGFDPTATIVSSNGTVISPTASAFSMLVFWKSVTDARKIDNDSVAGWKNRVLGVIVAADEELTQNWGIMLGGRVTRTGILINGSMHKQRTARVYHNSTEFLSTTTSIDGAGTIVTSYDSGTGTLTVNHDWLPGNTLHLQPDLRDGLITNVFQPVLKNIVSPTQFTMYFQDLAGTGAVYTGAPGTKMSFKFTKRYDGAVKFDGTDGWDIIPWKTTDANGNIWVYGAMQRFGS